MNILETIELLKVLADHSRLLILRALMDRPHYVEELAERLDLAVSTVSFHLKKMEKVNLVRAEKEQYYVTYHVQSEQFELKLRDLLDFEFNERDIQAERMARYREKVLNTFFKYGKLTKLPAQYKKRRIIYEEFVKQFEPNRTYTERDVNIIIADFYDDFCTIRRALIDEGFMDRKDGEYWLVSK